MSQRWKTALLMLFFSACGSAAMLSYYTHVYTGRVNPVDLYEAVNSQLNAFRAEDFPRAYQQASSGFQQRVNVGQFAELIRADFPGIVRAQRVEFGAFECLGRRATLQVFFIDREGAVFPCIYSLVSEGDAWKIDSARIMKRWPTGSKLGGIRS